MERFKSNCLNQLHWLIYTVCLGEEVVLVYIRFPLIPTICTVFLEICIGREYLEEVVIYMAGNQSALTISQLILTAC